MQRMYSCIVVRIAAVQFCFRNIKTVVVGTG